MANSHLSSNDDIPDSIRFSDEDWQHLRSEYPVQDSIQPANDSDTSEQSLLNLVKTNLAIAAEDLKKILPCLPEKERDRFIQEFGSMLTEG